jgi:hypothetical protein
MENHIALLLFHIQKRRFDVNYILIDIKKFFFTVKISKFLFENHDWYYE